MLKLPESMKIKRNRKWEDFLYEKSRDWLTRQEREEGIHASGLLDPRQAYFQTTDPKPLSRRLITMFLIGKVLHAFILSALAEEKGVNWASDGGGKFHKKLKIWYSPDKMFKGIPCEFKTSRSFYEPTHYEDLDSYCEQLMIYEVCEDKTLGRLWVLYLNLKNKQKQTSPEFRCYDVSISAGDKAKFAKQLADTRDALAKAIKAKRHNKLPLCRPYKCGDGNCEWWSKCKPEGRYGKTKKAWEA